MPDTTRHADDPDIFAGLEAEEAETADETT